MHRAIHAHENASRESRRSDYRGRHVGRNRHNSISVSDAASFLNAKLEGSFRVRSKSMNESSLTGARKKRDNSSRDASPVGNRRGSFVPEETNNFLTQVRDSLANAQDWTAQDESPLGARRRGSRAFSDTGADDDGIQPYGYGDGQYQPLLRLQTKGAAQLSEAVDNLLREHMLTEFIANQETLPIFMRAKDGFGYEGKEKLTLMHDEYQRWLVRCKSWAENARALRDNGVVNATITTLSFERISSSHVPLATIAQKCARLNSLSLQSCWISDGALSTFAICMRGRLRALTLTNSRGFRDAGVKALAGFCANLEELRLGGCLVTNEGVEKVAIFCVKLRQLEVTDSPAVSVSSLSHLRHDCVVVRMKPPAEDLLGTQPPEELLEMEANSRRYEELARYQQKRALIGQQQSDLAAADNSRMSRRKGSVMGMSMGMMARSSTRTSTAERQSTAERISTQQRLEQQPDASSHAILQAALTPGLAPATAAAEARDSSPVSGTYSVASKAEEVPPLEMKSPAAKARKGWWNSKRGSAGNDHEVKL